LIEKKRKRKKRTTVDIFSAAPQLQFIFPFDSRKERNEERWAERPVSSGSRFFVAHNLTRRRMDCLMIPFSETDVGRSMLKKNGHPSI
jgi:hypothetical protein